MLSSFTVIFWSVVRSHFDNSKRLISSNIIKVSMQIGTNWKFYFNFRYSHTSCIFFHVRTGQRIGGGEVPSHRFSILARYRCKAPVFFSIGVIANSIDQVVYHWMFSIPDAALFTTLTMMSQLVDFFSENTIVGRTYRHSHPQWHCCAEWLFV